MKSILLIKMGDTFAGLKERRGDFEDMMAACLHDTAAQLEVYDATQQQALPDLGEFSGVIITGSHSMVTAQEPWSERLIPYIKQMQRMEIPVLAICYGHQLVAKALGGEVGFHPQGPEPGSVEVFLTAQGASDSLLGTLDKPFKVNVAHSQTVTRLPEGATLLAENSFEPHQAYRCGNIWGLQFHPEFDREITQYYVDEIAEDIAAHGADPVSVREQCCDTAESRSLLVNFVEKICQAA